MLLLSCKRSRARSPVGSFYKQVRWKYLLGELCRAPMCVCVCLGGSEGHGSVCPMCGGTWVCTHIYMEDLVCITHGALWLFFQGSVTLGPTADFPT